MPIILKQAIAKVNLMLHITGKRGVFHEMQSIFAFINAIFDVLEFSTRFKFSDKSAEISGIKSKDNLIHKARNFLIAHEPDLFIPSVRVIKVIPKGAGLGGGSSDAACFINHVLNINEVSQDKRLKIAKKAHVLGMDVPIFLHRYMYNSSFLLLEGIGKFEEIREIDCEDNLEISLFDSEAKLSTKAIFDNYKDDFEKKQKIDICNLSFLYNSKNSLQNTAISMCPEILETLQKIKASGAKIARMSGSGPSCFGVYYE
ncbi:MAG: hypothetical protein LBP31_03605 [Holosporales bacterium]|nr:hypothetical protein [Holosporales bacterium]